MKEDPNADLKQFIAEQLKAAEKRIEQRIMLEVSAMGVRLMTEIEETNENVHQLSLSIGLLERRLTKKFDAKIDKLSSYVAEAIEIANDHHDAWLKDHEQRLRRLELNKHRSQQPHLNHSARIKS